MIPGTNGLRMPLSKPPVICGASLKAFSQKPMVPGAKTRAPGIWASSHLAVLYSMVEWMSMGLSIQRAERRCFLTTGTQAMANTRATARLVGQLGRGTLWVRPIVNRPTAALAAGQRRLPTAAQVVNLPHIDGTGRL